MGKYVRQQIDISKIIIDKKFQARVKGLDAEHVDNLAEEYERADSDIEPPRVWSIAGRDGFILTRGFHRLAALTKLKRKRVDCEVKSGTVSDALTDAAKSNHGHGKPRTNADKRHELEMLLEAHPEWSNRKLADEARVSYQFANDLRSQVTTVVTSNGQARVGRDGKTYTSSTKPRADKSDQVEESSSSESDTKKPEPTATPEPVKQCDDEPDEKSAPVQVDGWGIPIQAHAEKAFEAIPQFKEFVKRVRQFQKDLHELADGPGGQFLRKRMQGVHRPTKDNPKGFRWEFDGLKNVIFLLEDATPTYTVCPYMHNDEREHPENCATCWQQNWTGKLTGSIPPDLIKLAKAHYGVTEGK